MYILALVIGVAVSVGDIHSRAILWSCVAVGVIVAIIATLTLEPIAGRIGWAAVNQAPYLFVVFERSDRIETLTFSVTGHPITKLIIEPLSPTGDVQITMDPSEVLLLHPDRPVKRSILVEEGITTTGLARLLEKRHGSKIQIVFRFTDAQGKRKRIPFNVEIMGVHHQVEWVPGRAEDASPDS